jgi:hypothetical protein
MIWPTGSWSGKRVRATVAPRRQTFSATWTSRAVKSAPAASTQLRMRRNSSFPPSTEVLQFAPPAITWAVALTIGVQRATVGMSRARVWASSMVRLWTAPAPLLAVPRPPQLPDER